MYETIASPFNYGGLALKNRIIFAPTSLGLSQEEQVERLRRIAAGGCAMIIIGDVPVLPHGFGPSLYSRKGAALPGGDGCRPPGGSQGLRPPASVGLQSQGHGEVSAR